MAKDPTNSIKTWQVFLLHSWQEENHVLDRIKGGQIVYWQIYEDMDRATILSTSFHLRWIVVFPRLEVLFVLKDIFNIRPFFFYVDNASQLSPLLEAVIDYAYVMEHKIGIIEYDDCKWYIDPPMEDIKPH